MYALQIRSGLTIASQAKTKADQDLFKVGETNYAAARKAFRRADRLCAANAEIVHADTRLYYIEEYRTQAEQARNLAGGQDLDNP